VSAGLGRLRRLSSEAIAALPLVPSVAQHTATLFEAARTLKRIASHTKALPPIREDMGRVVEATSVLAAIDGRLSTIEEAMPVLVEVQRQLSRLPETIGTLDGRIERLGVQIDRMLPALDGLATNVEALRVGVGPVSRLASRVPGQRKPEAQS
jgi:hypothetical protein